jgi:hypothetical protein
MSDMVLIEVGDRPTVKVCTHPTVGLSTTENIKNRGERTIVEGMYFFYYIYPIFTLTPTLSKSKKPTKQQ